MSALYDLSDLFTNFPFTSVCLSVCLSVSLCVCVCVRVCLCMRACVRACVERTSRMTHHGNKASNRSIQIIRTSVDPESGTSSTTLIYLMQVLITVD